LTRVPIPDLAPVPWSLSVIVLEDTLEAGEGFIFEMGARVIGDVAHAVESEETLEA
jgi:hypothetical protein